MIKPLSNTHIIDGRWIYKIKLNQDGTINKRKTRYVAKEFQQKYDIDFFETYSNTVKSMFYRMLFAFVAFNDYELKQWNIKSIFLNANLKSHLRIYIKQFKNYETSDLTLICLLLKALYGFKQFAKQFYIFLRNLLTEFDFKSIIANQSIFFNFDIDIILAAHIDDLLIADKNFNKINELQKQL